MHGALQLNALPQQQAGHVARHRAIQQRKRAAALARLPALRVPQRLLPGHVPGGACQRDTPLVWTGLRGNTTAGSALNRCGARQVIGDEIGRRARQRPHIGSVGQAAHIAEA